MGGAEQIGGGDRTGGGYRRGGGDRTGGGDQTGGGAQTEGVISLTNKNISISYLIVITQVRFFQNFTPPSPISEKS